MKKYLALTSVLALAACGGGSGGGAMFASPRAVVVPDSQTVDSNSGLSMVDINKVRANKYQQAMATVRAIEGDYDFDTSFVINRAATLGHNTRMRTASQAGDSSDEPTITVDEAYALMNDILVAGNVNGKTNHEILVALALTGMDSSAILDLLGYNQSENETLDTRISDLVDDLLAVEKTQAIQDLINDAELAYRDFGTRFDLTLEDARFGTSSSGGRDFTFVFDENNNVTAINELWEGGRQYDAVGGGKFAADIVGTEYYIAIEKPVFDDDGNPVLDANGNQKIEIVEQIPVNANNSIFVDSKVYPNGDTLPTDSAIRQILLNNALDHFDDNAVNERAALTTWFYGDTDSTADDVPVIGYGESCTRPAGCIMYAHVDYNDSITVESKGQALGLQYSDFGLKLDKMVFNSGDERYPGLTYKEHTVFAGGYDGDEENANANDNKRATPGEAMTFSGVAFAGVTRKSNNYESLDDYQEPDINYYNGTAVLTVARDNNDNDALKANLAADFSGEGWYTVNVTGMNLAGNGGGNGGNISFTGTPTNSDFAVNQNASSGTVEQSYIRYYGPNPSTPTEVVGAVQYVERPQGVQDETDWTFKADMSFGAKRVNGTEN